MNHLVFQVKQNSRRKPINGHWFIIFARKLVEVVSTVTCFDQMRRDVTLRVKQVSDKFLCVLEKVMATQQKELKALKIS